MGRLAAQPGVRVENARLGGEMSAPSMPNSKNAADKSAELEYKNGVLLNGPGISYTEPDIGAEFVPPIPANPRPKIVALCDHCTNRMLGKKKLLPYEYWSFAEAATDEEADVLLKLKVRVPYTLAQAVKATGMEESKLEALLDKLSYTGLLEYNWENPTRTKQWMLPMLVPGSAEFLNMRMNQLGEHPVFAKFFEQASKGPLSRATPMVPPGGAGIGMHVIPVEQAIDAASTSVPIEHITHWLDKYDGKYAASMCSCRASRQILGEGCGDDARDWCIAVGDMADYIVETDRGHYIDRDEVLDILRQAEDNGFVHQITNIDGENKIFAICNCNVNVCYALRTSQLFNTPNLSRSAYVAKTTADKCVACGGCVEVCPAGAVKLGQKLCSKTTGQVPEYPRQELPDATKWGPEKWSPDYRNKNRIETYDGGTAPCKTACPAHISVQGYLKLAAQGRYQEALALIKQENPLPAVCGRICNRACEDVCTRAQVDEAIAIDEVKKFLADLDLDAATRYIPPQITPTRYGGFDQKVAIVGAGPAGLSCAFYLAQLGYKPHVFERHARPGGMLTYGIPSYKLEKPVIEAEVNVIEAMGATIHYGVNVGTDVTLQELRSQGFAAFYLAIGCQGGRLPNIPNQMAPGTWTAVDFLVTYANQAKAAPQAQDAPATTVSAADNNEDSLGHVVVVGGGNVAIDAARVSARMGAASVTMLSLEDREHMPASEEEILEATEDGVDIRCGWGPKEVVVGADGQVTGVTFKQCTSVFDEEGRFAPTYNEEVLLGLECDQVIFAIGQAIVWGQLLEGSRVELGRGQGPVADPVTYQTAEPDIFVGGDVYTGPRFAIDAIAAGHEAAISVHRFVQKGTLTIGRNARQYSELNKADADLSGYDTATREQPHHVAAANAKARPFNEYLETFTEAQVKRETSRCLSCGASVVDPNKCIGCGLCTTKCEFDAIHLYRERPECSTMIKSEDKLGAVAKYALKRAIKIRFGKH